LSNDFFFVFKLGGGPPLVREREFQPGAHRPPHLTPSRISPRFHAEEIASVLRHTT